MTTIKEFKTKIEMILNVINQVNKSNKPMSNTQWAFLFDGLKQLQPPRPTCSTCKYFTPGISIDGCINKDSELYHRRLSRKTFGCINHSSYGDE